MTQNLRKLRVGQPKKDREKIKSKGEHGREGEGGDDWVTAVPWVILRSNCSWRREEPQVTFIFVRSGTDVRARSDFRLSIVRE